MRRRFGLIAIVVLLVGCSGAVEQAPAQITVFAAASLSESFEALGSAFRQANPNVNLAFNFAGSQQLAAQIAEGAPADLFAAAHREQLAAAVASGRIAANTVQIFAINQLVVVVPADNPGQISKFGQLAQPNLHLVLADPAVPVGQYSQAVLAAASADPGYSPAFSPMVLANVVSFEDNVRAVLAKVALGEADAGIVYRTDAATVGSEVTTIAIPPAFNPRAEYPIAPLSDSPNLALAEAFMQYVLSEPGQAILGQYGFTQP